MPKEVEEIAAEQLKSARVLGSTTTNIALVLFAALIVSYLGMWDGVPKYRGAIGYQRWFTKHKRIADLANLSLLGDRVKGVLREDAIQLGSAGQNEEDSEQHAVPAAALPMVSLPPGKGPFSDTETQRCTAIATYQTQAPAKPRDQEDQLLCTALAAAIDPYGVLAALKKNNDWRASYLYRAIEGQSVFLTNLNREKSRALGHLDRKRYAAQKTQFRLFGLDFSVNGYWAWNVWYLLFTVGLAQIWLARRAILRRCRLAWSDGPLPANSSLRDTFPFWLRPLPVDEPWAKLFSNPVRVDIVMDPLSFVCTALLWLCFAIAILAVLRLIIISSFLLNGPGTFGLNAILHAIVGCILSGAILAIVADWYLPRKRKDAAGVPTKEARNGITLVNRRVWLMAAVASIAAAVLYRNPVNRMILKSLLRDPRFNEAPAFGATTRKRRRKLQNVELAEGFYEDQRGAIHYVPANKRARSLGGVPNEDLSKWTGSFDESVVHLVRPGALIAFVRAGVVSHIGGYRHRTDSKQRSQLLASQEVRNRYLRAFNLTKAAILVSEQRRRDKSKMPNLQLYDILAAIAINFQSPELLHSARQLLNSVQLKQMYSVSDASKEMPSGCCTQMVKHNGHAKHKAHKVDAWCRRWKALIDYKTQRLGTSPTPESNLQRGHGTATSIGSYSSPPGDATESSAARHELVAVGLRQGTWNPHILDADTANAIHVVPPARHRHRENRITPRYPVKCAGAGRIF